MRVDGGQRVADLLAGGVLHPHGHDEIVAPPLVDVGVVMSVMSGLPGIGEESVSSRVVSVKWAQRTASSAAAARPTG